MGVCKDCRRNRSLCAGFLVASDMDSLASSRDPRDSVFRSDVTGPPCLESPVLRLAGSGKLCAFTNLPYSGQRYHGKAPSSVVFT